MFAPVETFRLRMFEKTALRLWILAVRRLDEIAFIFVMFSRTFTLILAIFARLVVTFVKNAFEAVTAFAAHMLLPGPFK